jgi:hypothetical protein
MLNYIYGFILDINRMGIVEQAFQACLFGNKTFFHVQTKRMY